MAKYYRTTQYNLRTIIKVGASCMTVGVAAINHPEFIAHKFTYTDRKLTPIAHKTLRDIGLEL